MTFIYGSALFFATFCVLILLVELADRWIAKAFPGEVEMPTPEQPRPTNRFVFTLPGDTLAQGVHRALILSSEYDCVVLLHLGTPVCVTWESDPYSVDTEWRQTRQIQEARKVCNGK
jgi:hypothetical protein